MSHATPNNSESTPSLKSDLDFLAFRYVANEMSEGERIAFENRLADDLEACEAVASAVELTQALALTAGELSPSVELPPLIENDTYVTPAAVSRDSVSAARSWHPATWMSLGAALCLVAVLIAQSLTGDRGIVENRVANNDGHQSGNLTPAQLQAEARAEKLALMWSQIRHVDTHSESAEEVEPLTSEISDEPATTPSAAPSGSRSPSWITAAISELSKTTKDESETMGSSVKGL